MQSLLDMYREGGWLPKWPNPGYTGIMVGAPAEIVLEEAMAKGFSGFDHDLAREAIRKKRTVPQKFDLKRRWRDREEYGEYPETRAGLTSYLKRGYVACDETDESVSRTLDFSFADRNKAYTNLWCASAGSFLPRRADGTFDADAKHAYTECRAETAVWCVPHDPEGLASLMGGNAAAVKRLDEFFETLFWKPERGNKSIHGNEPSHHCAYLYNRFGASEKTQQRVREILARSYSTDRKGFDGNEDCGQMSAWYIFSALGTVGVRNALRTSPTVSLFAILYKNGTFAAAVDAFDNPHFHGDCPCCACRLRRHVHALELRRRRCGRSGAC